MISSRTKAAQFAAAHGRHEKPKAATGPRTIRYGLAMRCMYRPVLAVAWWALLMLAAPTPASADQDRESIAYVAELDGIIHPISAEYLTGVIDRADTSGADLVVIILRTPGGLLDSTRTIVSRMITSRAPVVVFVGPAGARAASAGFVLTMAADVAAMAPGTHIGAAHPVSGSGQQMDEATAKKAASDTAAYVRSLVEARHRNVMLAEQAVIDSRAFTDTEALGATPPLIDLVAPDVGDLLRRLDGRTITRFDGRSATVRTQSMALRRVEMTRRQRFLGTIADPHIAYLLLTLGMIGLTVEFWNPGAIFPGVAGGLSLLLAFFAFQILPVNTSGLLLIAFGLALLVLELKVPSFGALGMGGAASLLIGSLMLTRDIPGVRLGLSLIVPAVASVAAIVFFLGRLALAAHRQPPVTGAEALVGQQARTRTAVSPAAGLVDFRGEIWRAISDSPIDVGRMVRIRALNGLTLTVEAEGTPTREGDTTCKA
jgi:membrane-bound serine protease (ClpP class)